MMTKNADKKREQMMMFSMDDMVPQNHMLRLIDKAINWNFIYDLVENIFSYQSKMRETFFSQNANDCNSQSSYAKLYSCIK